MPPEKVEAFDRWAVRAFPRLHTWFAWFNSTQVGPLASSYRWRGRPTNNPFQLNPLTLASGKLHAGGAVGAFSKENATDWSYYDVVLIVAFKSQFILVLLLHSIGVSPGVTNLQGQARIVKLFA